MGEDGHPTNPITYDNLTKQIARNLQLTTHEDLEKTTAELRKTTTQLQNTLNQLQQTVKQLQKHRHKTIAGLYTDTPTHP